MSNQNNSSKPTTPLQDAIRVFLRNKPAVLSLVMIVMLAISAVSGKILVGKQPTEDQLKLIEKAEITGDTLDLDVNPSAVFDHNKTQLKDTFLSPGSASNEIEGKTYYLGTDDLGRDVLARLWGGSTISLTIGFLSVGISVLLGIALGGIAGYFGRSRVRLPLLATLILTAGGGVLWAAEKEALAIPFLAVAAGFVAVQVAMAALGERYRALIAFLVVIALFAGIRFYNRGIETGTPEGRMYTSASAIAEQSYSLVRAIRDAGNAVKLIEDGDAAAWDETTRREAQQSLDVLQAELDVALATHDKTVHEATLEITERSLGEYEARIELLKSVNLPDDAKAAEAMLAGARKRLEDLKTKTAAIEKAVTEKEAAAKAVSERKLDTLQLAGSNQLLDRRAGLRKTVVDKFRAERDNRFETLVKGKMLDGSTRYRTFRILRHFLTAVVLYLLMVVTILFVAADAQAAATESKNPLRAVFVPTITVDDLVMRFTEIMLTIPVIFLILMVLALFERDVYIVMAVIGLTSWMGTTRFVRAEILSLREQDFIQAARSLGISDFRIIWRHLVPNAISPVLVSATIGVAGAVLAESTLSFLGIGAGPDQDTWGKILADGRLFLNDAPWLTWIPGLAILFTVLAFNLLGEGLREAFNPKLRGR